MKHPFWIVNSTLLGLFILSAIVIYFFQVPVPERQSIEALLKKQIKQEESIDIDIKKIYTNDLFNTYHQQATAPLYPSFYTPQIPEPPVPQEIIVPAIPKPQFLEPLNVVLKGIIVVNNSETPSSIILENKQSGKEYNYLIGDMIEDARLIRVFPTKVVLLRANGQQEIIYLNEDDAHHDPSFMLFQEWEKVIQKIAPHQYLIDPQEFALRITSLAQFIDTIGLVTAYKKGTSIGCRLGKIMDQTLSSLLDLKTGDIIVSVNGISTATTLDRLRIYKMVIALHENESFEYIVQRKNEQFTTKITFGHLTKNSEKNAGFVEKNNEKDTFNALLEQKKLAPTLREIEKQERQNMVRFGTPISNYENNNDK